MKQYLLSFYWACTSLTTNGLAGYMTPKNQTELTFTILCMVCTLTIYSYVVGAHIFGATGQACSTVLKCGWCTNLLVLLIKLLTNFGT